MKLFAAELAYIRSQGVYITEKCDACGKILNQTLRYTITGKLGVYSSAACRELAFFRDRHEAKKESTPGKCAYCRGAWTERNAARYSATTPAEKRIPGKSNA